MKTLIIVAMLGLAAALFAGCGGPVGEPVLISDHEGCKMYRVSPGFFEHYVYYTVCAPGQDARTQSSHTSGKTTVQDSVDTQWFYPRDQH